MLAFQEEVDTLSEMFPAMPHARILDILSSHTLKESIEMLLPVNNPQYLPSYETLSNSAESVREEHLKVVPSLPGDDATKEQLLSKHAAKIIDFDNDVTISMKRENIWRKAKAFYKIAINSRERLMKNLVVEFESERGIDAGALKIDFIEKVMESINNDLFEGDTFKRLPRAEWGNNKDFEMAGIMVAQSVLLGGPSLSCLSPVMYSYYLSGSADTL